MKSLLDTIITSILRTSQHAWPLHYWQQPLYNAEHIELFTSILRTLTLMLSSIEFNHQITLHYGHPYNTTTIRLRGNSLHKRSPTELLPLSLPPLAASVSCKSVETRIIWFASGKTFFRSITEKRSTFSALFFHFCRKCNGATLHQSHCINPTWPQPFNLNSFYMYFEFIFSMEWFLKKLIVIFVIDLIFWFHSNDMYFFYNFKCNQINF